MKSFSVILLPFQHDAELNNSEKVTPLWSWIADHNSQDSETSRENEPGEIGMQAPITLYTSLQNSGLLLLSFESSLLVSIHFCMASMKTINPSSLALAVDACIAGKIKECQQKTEIECKPKNR